MSTDNPSTKTRDEELEMEAWLAQNDAAGEEGPKPIHRTGSDFKETFSAPTITRRPENHFDIKKYIPEIVKPGEYIPAYCDAIRAYFDKPKMRVIEDTYTWKSGEMETRTREIPATPPHFTEFARTIGVSNKKLKAWCRKYPEFADAYEMCEEIYEEFLIEHGLMGNYGAIMAKFVAVNKTKMKDKVVSENRTVNLNEVLDQIERGQLKPGGILLENLDESY